jgi:hypothetical protein
MQLLLSIYGIPYKQKKGKENTKKNIRK